MAPAEKAEEEEGQERRKRRREEALRAGRHRPEATAWLVATLAAAAELLLQLSSLSPAAAPRL